MLLFMYAYESSGIVNMRIRVDALYNTMQCWSALVLECLSA